MGNLKSKLGCGEILLVVGCGVFSDEGMEWLQEEEY